MPLKMYGVLKCRVEDSKPGEKSNPHYQVLVTEGKFNYRIDINVQSKQSPSELLYFVNNNFQHPITQELTQLGFGFNNLDSKAGGLALDFIRGNMFDVQNMKPLPFEVQGPENDLNELLDVYIQRAISERDAVIYAYGEKWGPDKNIPDKVFHFLPGKGIHNIHMNQGNSKQFRGDDGVWQDGGLLINFPSRNQWVAVFLAFQSQALHTDDVTGHQLDDAAISRDTAGVRIIAAMVNPIGDDVGKESVTLINTSPNSINLTGWAIADKFKHKRSLDGTILPPGAFVRIPLSGDNLQLSNDGGIITLLDDKGLKIHGVSYTKSQAKNAGWTILF